MKISDSLSKFLYNLIDYAGLFPPAGLKPDIALSNYLEYLSSEFNFALNKFIIPVSRLSDASDFLKKSDYPQTPVSFSVIPSAGKSIGDVRDSLIHDLDVCKKFIEEFQGSVEINSYEIKLPEELLISDNPVKYYDLISYINEKINSLSDKSSVIYFEGLLNEEWKVNSEKIIEAVYKNNLNNFPCGFKLRTGGLTPEAFPESHQIAFCLRQCLDTKVPVKFTAGLHHPFRHFDKSIGAEMHGFVNVFGAGITAMRHNITNEGLTEMLDDGNPDNFKFTDDSFTWKGWETEIDDIVYARNDLVISYGSCSFTEPIDDLKSLKLIY
ncbi:MAG TPA: hypothetical protein PKA90_02910 [Ignavibacteria bacterium]|nr:hypothetical protein [Ignavibacteria bacterium]HMR39359.1 hypothetical protein [Ignavibacteria bacterium]